MTAIDQLFTPYNGTGGYVERPTSIARAVQEVEDGTLSKRQQAVLQLLDNAGKNGCIWQAVGQQLNLHHGQASGVLSNLHKAGEIFMLRKKVMRCHPYVAKQFRHYYTDEQVFDTPATTRAGERTALLNELYATCQTAKEFGWSAGMQQSVTTIVDMIAAHDTTT
jgi:folate-dependent tRNA-U54 methylase TrmFO/GidA